MFPVILYCRLRYSFPGAVAPLVVFVAVVSTIFGLVHNYNSCL